jgi:Ni,Fe-hydrogenase III large subunit
MSDAPPLRLHNGQAALLEDVPRLPISGFRDAVLRAVDAGARLSALYGQPAASGAGVQLWAVLADDYAGALALLCSDPVERYAALTPDCPQAQAFERELAEQWGVQPEGHPWLKPLRFHASYGSGPAGSGAAQRSDASGLGEARPMLPGVTDHFQVRGEQVHEVAVGPVHAGIIEPGHFRFQCSGETVLHLEISLGYQHRGVERALIGGPDRRSIHYAETLCGDTSVGHATAYCELLEALAGLHVPARAQVLRAVALELERLANHTGDLGALANDVGYLPGASYCGRLRGDWLNMTSLICGSRLGRGMVRAGGVGFDVTDAQVAQLRDRLEATLRDVTGAAGLLWNTSSVMARFEETGPVAREVCEQLGLVGVAARACGLERDVRFEHPSGLYRMAQIPVSTWDTGDVFARAYVRWLEIQRSAVFIRDHLAIWTCCRAAPSATAGPGRWRPIPSQLRWSRAGAARSATSR